LGISRTLIVHQLIVQHMHYTIATMRRAPAGLLDLNQVRAPLLT
jgi:hypothetical protein